MHFGTRIDAGFASTFEKRRLEKRTRDAGGTDILAFMMCAALGFAVFACSAPPDPAIVEPQGGRTIEMKDARKAVLPEQPVENDKGVNVLLDHAHQAGFQMMWEMPPALRSNGFRVSGSHASLSSVLAAKGKSRIRIRVGKRMPFAWWPNPKYNMVLTYQHDPRAQDYLPEEVAALKAFVRRGGGLVMCGGPVNDPKLLESYPLNRLAKEFGAEITGEAVAGPARAAVVKGGPEWKSVFQAEGKTVVESRTYGKGHVVLCGDPGMVSWDDKAAAGAPRSQQAVLQRLTASLWDASQGMKPVGGTLRLPMEDGGVGGPIYPELEERVEGAVVYYAANQFKTVLDTVRNDMPKVDANVRAWTPSPTPKDPMFLVLAAGYGGGWAVNIYEPKEVGIIAPDPNEILSILAHEVAHTCYSGPPNDNGRSAGELPGVFSEAHAGWFQRRSDAQRNHGKTGHQPNNLFSFDKDGTAFDLAHSENAPYGQAWTKIWWLWQKLDERYGVTWYPRWLWVKNVRWAATPAKELSWDEVVEDMSIACGEDLFPFFRKIGTTLTKDRFASAEFQGKTLQLPVADIPLGPCGEPIVDRIGDYKQPVARR